MSTENRPKQIEWKHVDNREQVFYGLKEFADPLAVHSILFDTSIQNPSLSTGELIWDYDNKTLAFKTADGGFIQVNQEPFDYYTNLEGAAIVNGDIVSTCGASGNRTAICLTDATNDAKSLAALGMVTVSSINNNNIGRITKSGGKVRELNTIAYPEGTVLYVDPLNKGKWTSSMPSAPNRAIKIGIVTVSHSNQGVVELDIQVLPKMTELADVNGTPLTVDGQIPVWHQSTNVFDFDVNIYMQPAHKVGTPTDNTEFELDGTIRFNGNATVFDDLTGDITRTKTVGTRVALNDSENTIDFSSSATTSDYLFLSYQMSHKWMSGTNIYPHIHYQQNNLNTPNFLIQYRWQRNGQPKTTAWLNLICNTNVFTYVSGTINQISYGAFIGAPVGYSISDIIQIRVIRDTSNSTGLFAGADSYTGTVSVTAVDIHYQIDTIGSRDEYLK